MLQAYLQSVMNLPIKDKNEIIVFFSSDVVREQRTPVTQSGYKEGYLTKRGKNFGGWKTRYFVLHGPVLDYYESVRISVFSHLIIPLIILNCHLIARRLASWIYTGIRVSDWTTAESWRQSGLG